jgi:DnaA-homolog protein
MQRVIPKNLPQLPLCLSLKDDAAFENFYPGANVEAIESIKKAASGQGEKIIYVCAGRGQGLSHLLQAACHEAARYKVSAVYLPISSLLSEPPEMLHGLESLQLVCLDDLQSLASSPQWEEAVFHLFNRVHDAGGTLILAANDLPNALPLSLPDLKSRLSYGVIYQLHPLTDAEKINVLIGRAKARGITLSEEVGKYLLSHCPRHMSTLLAALDALDRASLAAQRRLTIPFVKEVLEIL